MMHRYARNAGTVAALVLLLVALMAAWWRSG